MQLFIDSANIDEIRAAVPYVGGVTINPSLLAKIPKQPLEEYIKEVALLFPRTPRHELHLQTPDLTTFVSVTGRRGDKIRCIAKVPITEPKRFDDFRGIATNATCIFDEAQAYAAVALGASFVSFFWGRIADRGDDPKAIVTRVKNNFLRKSIRVEIIAGSIRNKEAALAAFDAGADIVTTSLPVLESLFQHPGSVESQAKFAKDWDSWTS